MLEKLAGYDGNTMKEMPYIDLPAGGWAGHTVSEGILFICTLIPAIVYTLVWILMQFGYPLTKKRLEPVYAYVREQREKIEHEASDIRVEDDSSESEG